MTITSAVGGTTDPSPGRHAYDAGTDITIKAIPDAGYGFSHWSGDVSSSENPVALFMDKDQRLRAHFIRQYSLSIAAGEGGTTDPLPAVYAFDRGTRVAITAIPDRPFFFNRWNGDVSRTANPISLNMNADKSVFADFLRMIYAPLNFSCRKILNPTSLIEEYINVLAWLTNPDNVNIVKYRIYSIEGELRLLLAELNADINLYVHRPINKGQSYTYELAAVNNEGREGAPARISVE